MKKNDHIEIAPYNPKWPSLFEVEAKKIQGALGDNCIAIHHIGSTAVEGLSAKPIIDIMVVAQDIRAIDLLSQSMLSIGYEAKGEYGIPFRRYFQKGSEVRTHNLHIFEQANPEIDHHLKFRDWMRTHPDDLEAYAHLKQKLATTFFDNREAYSIGKDDFIASICTKAGWNGVRMVRVHTPKEWAAFHRIRKEQIFDPINVKYDPNYSSITAASHFNFALLSGADIISVAMVEILNDAEAFLRSFATDGSYQDQGFGKIMMGYLEQWLRHKNIKTIKMHSAKRAEGFYRKLGYDDVIFNDSSVISNNTVSLGKTL